MNSFEFYRSPSAPVFVVQPPQPPPPPTLDTSSNRNNVLQIRNLVPEIAYTDRDELLYGLGATSVHNYPLYTIVYFADENACHKVIGLLHQRRWPSSSSLSAAARRIRVEFLSPNQTESRIINEHTVCDTSLKRLICQEKNNALISSVSNKCGALSSAANSRFFDCTDVQFRFPPVSASVIHRIGTLLQSNEHFYHHVLLLMCKLNLDPPFDDEENSTLINLISDAESPHISAEISNKSTIANSKRKQDDNLLASDESELESSFEEVSNFSKRDQFPARKRIKRKPKKNLPTGFVGDRASLAPTESYKKPKPIVSTSIEEVFESSLKPKTLKLKINVPIETSSVESVDKNDGDINKHTDEKAQPKIDLVLPEKSVQKEEKNVQKCSIAFDLVTMTEQDLIPDSDLNEKCVPPSEWSQYSVFKNYSTGDIGNRLYVKNLNPRRTTKQDLYRLFAKFIQLDNDSHLKSFDINYMDKGRLRGQAFVTFPSETIAEEALRRTNGYLMDTGKPIVVAFARSQKEHG